MQWGYSIIRYGYLDTMSKWGQRLEKFIHPCVISRNVKKHRCVCLGEGGAFLCQFGSLFCCVNLVVYLLFGSNFHVLSSSCIFRLISSCFLINSSFIYFLQTSVTVVNFFYRTSISAQSFSIRPARRCFL